MRYIILLVTMAVVYVVLARSGSITPAATAVTQSMEAAAPAPATTATATAATTPTNAFKAPLDRTHAVLDQVRKQKSSDQF